MRPKYIATIAALLMLAVTLPALVAAGNGVEHERRGDWYLSFGDNLWAGRGWHDCVPVPDSWHCGNVSEWTANRLPLYPAYLALLMPIAGENTPFVARAGQALMIAGAVWLAVHLAGRVAGAGAAIATGLLCVVAWSAYPTDGMVLGTEPLYTLMITAFAYGVVLYPRRAAWWGVLWGVSLLTRGNLLLATPALAALVIAQRRSWRAGVAFAGGVALPVALWTLRNAAVLGAFVPFSTGSGHLLYGTYNDMVKGLWWDDKPLAVIAPAVGWSELAHDAEGKRLAFAWLERHANPVELFMQKALTSWHNPVFDAPFYRAKGATALGAGALFGIALWIVRRPRMTENVAALLGVGIIYALTLTINNTIFYSIFRFRQPLEPLLFAALSVFAITSLCAKRRKTDNAKRGARRGETGPSRIWLRSGQIRH